MMYCGVRRGAVHCAHRSRLVVTQRTVRGQRGLAVVMVMLLLLVMLLGGLSMARLTEVGTLATGNLAYREAAVQAGEVGLSTAFVAVKALASEDDPVGNWYWPTMQQRDASGLPVIGWDSTPEIEVGQYKVRYAVERMCDSTPVIEPLRQCLLKVVPFTPESRVYGRASVEPPSARQFRISVRIRGPKSTETWVQTLVTRG